MCLWSPVRRQLASGSSDGVCRLWGLWDMTTDKWAGGETEILVPTAIMSHSHVEGTITEYH